MTTHPVSSPPRRSDRVRFHLSGPSTRLDPRVHAVRHDLADVSLAGVLFAPHYARAHAMHCIAPGTFVRGRNNQGANAVTQILPGETFHVLDITGDWAWGFCGHDGYVGYVARTHLGNGEIAATHRITARAAPVFVQSDIKSSVVRTLPIGARVVGDMEGDFLVTDQGYVHTRHVAAVGHNETDHVAEALRHIGQPYVWGGRGDGGIDCSGLVQVALDRCGISAPRDSDMQREGVGVALSPDAPLERGDILFFPGHVGIMTDDENMVHANAYWMTTLVEPLADVIARLLPSYPEPVLARRRISL